MPALEQINPISHPFWRGVRGAYSSIFLPVIGGTYLGIGALAHDFGFSALWFTIATLVIWAGPAQLILVSTLGSGGRPIEAAIAVALSGLRLLPMVVALLPLLRTPGTRLRQLILPTHLTSISMWVESLRLLPRVPKENRIAFCNGLSAGFMSMAAMCGLAGFYLAAGFPPLLAAALLFLTPLSFLTSTAKNCRVAADHVAFVLGLVVGPLLAAYHVELDLLWTGIIGGVVAFGVHRWREASL